MIKLYIIIGYSYNINITNILITNILLITYCQYSNCQGNWKHPNRYKLINNIQILCGIKHGKRFETISLYKYRKNKKKCKIKILST